MVKYELQISPLLKCQAKDDQYNDIYGEGSFGELITRITLSHGGKILESGENTLYVWFNSETQAQKFFNEITDWLSPRMFPVSN